MLTLLCCCLLYTYLIDCCCNTEFTFGINKVLHLTYLTILKEEASDTTMPNEDQATGILEEDQTAETEGDKSPSKEDKTGWFEWGQCQKCTSM